MDIQMKITMMILAWCLIVPSLLGSSNSNDPILKHMCCRDKGLDDCKRCQYFKKENLSKNEKDLKILSLKKLLASLFASKYAALINYNESKSVDDVGQLRNTTAENGAKFWRNFLECGVVLQSQILSVLNACIPVSTEEEAERTRCSVCSKPESWRKMMDCMNMQLIEHQDENNPHLELSPGLLYRTCVKVLIEEAETALEKDKSFLPEDDRTVTSSCSKT